MLRLIATIFAPGRRKMGFDGLNVWLMAAGIKHSDLRPSNTSHLRQSDICKLPAGTHIAIRWKQSHIASHHAIYIGNNEIVDFNSEGVQRRNVYDDFIGNGGFYDLYQYQYEEDTDQELQQTVKRALDALEYPMDMPAYDFLVHNCEAFAVSCRTGRCGDGMFIIRELATTRNPPIYPQPSKLQCSWDSKMTEDAQKVILEHLRTMGENRKHTKK